MNWAVVVNRLADAAVHRGRTAVHPTGTYIKGRPVPGSCTDQVLMQLRSQRGRPATLRQIADVTGLVPRRISWSLLYLRSQGFVCSREIRPNVHEWWAVSKGQERRVVTAPCSNADRPAIPVDTNTLTDNLVEGT